MICQFKKNNVRGHFRSNIGKKKRQKHSNALIPYSRERTNHNFSLHINCSVDSDRNVENPHELVVAKHIC